MRRLFAPATVHVGEVQRIDLQGRRAIVARGIDGQRTEVSWDHVVLGLGTEDRTDAYPGLVEHAFKLRAYEDCFALKNHVIDMFELADVERDAEERRRLLTFFIAGGGFAGVEVAGELADFARRLTGEGNEYPRLRYEECRFLLVHPEPTILPELRRLPGVGTTGDQAHRGARRRASCGDSGRVRNAPAGDAVNRRSHTDAYDHQRRRHPAQPARGRRSISKRTSEDASGWSGRDSWRAGATCGREGIARRSRCPRGATVPSVALYAYKHGEHIGRNLRRVLLEDEPPKPFKWPGLAQGASVGRRWAVGEVKGIQVTGLPAWLIWRLLLTYYFPSWDRRLRLFADWLIWPVVGRDIVGSARR